MMDCGRWPMRAEGKPGITTQHTEYGIHAVPHLDVNHCAQLLDGTQHLALFDLVALQATRK